jgi:hypothetical protein
MKRYKKLYKYLSSISLKQSKQRRKGEKQKETNKQSFVLFSKIKK